MILKHQTAPFAFFLPLTLPRRTTPIKGLPGILPFQKRFIKIFKCYVFIFVILFVYLFPVLGLHYCEGFFLVLMSGGWSLGVVCGVLTAVASLVEAPGSGAWTSVAALPRLNCSSVCGIFQDQESNPRSLHWQADSYLLSHWESPAKTSGIDSGIHSH